MNERRSYDTLTEGILSDNTCDANHLNPATATSIGADAEAPDR
jgi:hypothetical protein